MTELAVLAINAGAALPGALILRALGFSLGGPWGLGPSYLAGLASILFVQVIATPLGLPPTEASVLAIYAVLSLASLWLSRKSRAVRQSPGPSIPPTWARLGYLAVGLVGALLLFNLLTSEFSSQLGFDAWSQWMPKAELLAHQGLSGGTLWGRSVYSYVNPEYPIALPLLDADQLSFLNIASGSSRLSLLAISSWSMLAAFACTLLWLRGRRGGLVLIPVIACFAVAPGVILQTREALADVPLAIFISLGALLVADWLEEGRYGQLVLGTLFLATGANLKDEGSAAAIIVCLVGAAAPLLRRDGRRAAHASIALGAVLLAIVPWRVWLAVHHIHGVIHLGQAISPSYLLSRSSRASSAFDALLSALARPGEFLLLPAAALALMLLVLVGRHRFSWRAGYFLVLTGLYLVTVGWAEWASPLSIQIYLPEADRFVTTAGALALVALVDLCPRLLSEPAGRLVDAG